AKDAAAPVDAVATAAELRAIEEGFAAADVTGLGRFATVPDSEQVGDDPHEPGFALTCVVSGKKYHLSGYFNASGYSLEKYDGVKKLFEALDGVVKRLDAARAPAKAPAKAPSSEGPGLAVAKPLPKALPP